VSYEDSHARTKVKMCCFDFVLGFYNSFSHATGRPHTPYPIHGGKQEVYFILLLLSFITENYNFKHALTVSFATDSNNS
jgi:hypothetical protein